MKRRSAGRPGSGRPGRCGGLSRWTRGLAATLALAAAACGGDGSEDAGAPEESAPEASTASLPSARYLTLVAWSAPGGRPAGVLWLENRTGSSDSLDRRYRGWSLDGDRPRPLLSVDDRLPARSAAWRPLPSPGLGLSVDTRGQLTAIRLDGGDFRLRTGRELASWRGAGGQRQRLLTGRLRTAGDTAAVEVTVALLRFEHLAGEPGRLGPSRLLFLAAAERGLLVLGEGRSRPWSRGWGWDAGGRVSRLRAGSLPDSVRPEGGWRIAVPGDGTGPPTEWIVAAEDAPPPPASPGEFVLGPASAGTGGEAGAPRARGFLLRAAGAGPDPGGG